MYSQRLSIHSSAGEEHRLQRDQISPCKRDHDNFDREVVISVHNGAQEKFAGLSAGGYFCMTDRPDEFHGVQNPYKRPERMSDLVVVHLRDLAFGEMNDFTVLCGELCVDPFKFGRIYTVVKEADTEDAIALSIVAPNFLSMDQSYAGWLKPRTASFGFTSTIPGRLGD
jgi:hypothetical protein